MHELVQSNVKTQHSYIDNASAKDNKDSDYSQKIEQFRNILKWVHKNSQLRYLAQAWYGKKVDFSYFMVKIESFNSLVFRKCYQQSKVYLILIAKLVNIRTNKKYAKITRIVKILEQASTYTYDMKQPLIFYFYTSSQSEILMNIEVLLSEQEIKAEGSLPIFGSPENIGSVQIDLSKQRKGKEKKYLLLPNEFSFTPRDANEGNIYSTSYVNILVNKSQAYRYLEKIIPENTLCDPSDKIAGVMGYFLPMSQNTLTDFSLTSESHSLRLNFSNIEVNTALLKEANHRAELIVKSKHSLLNKISSVMGEVVIRVKFHNGWKTVSESTGVLKEKGDIHMKTNYSNISDFQNMQTNPKITQGRKSQQNQLKIKGNYKHYTCENALILKLIFPNEDECVLIYQIEVDVTVKGEIQNDQKKQLPDLFQEVITVPLCFGINSAKSIGNYRLLTCSMNIGGCLRSFQSLKASIQQSYKQINLLKKSQAARISIQSKLKAPSILMDIDTISNNNKTLKTLDNVSNLSIKSKRNDIGILDFQMQMQELQEINLHVQQNLSIPFQNFSSLNVSKMDFKDKIQLQKERISKESKKNLAIIKSNKLDIGFLKEIVISQHQKQNLAKTLPHKENSVYMKENFLKLLKQQMDKHGYSQVKLRIQNEKKTFKNQSKQITSEGYQRTLYNFQLSKTSPEHIIQNKASKYFYYLFSNRILNDKYYFKYETIPIEIIKTELSQISYNNCYFINFMQVTNHINGSIVRFPKIFYFKMKFYNHEDIRSEIMTINKDTGEIVLVDAENSSNKVMHIEVNIDDQPSNYLIKFMQFIQFMHNGVINVDIIDYITGLSFGIFTIPLRSLIRKRRNEVVFIHEDCIYHNNRIKANLKVELRAIRKMRYKNNVEIVSPAKTRESPSKQEQVSQIKQEGEKRQKDLRLERIQRYKESKNRSIIQLPQVDKQLQVQSSKIAKMISKAYTHEKVKIAASYLKKQFFFIEVNNKHESTTTYSISIKDEDKKWIENNPLSGQQQITIVKDPSRLEKQDYQMLTASKKYQEKMIKCLALNQEEQLQLSARGKGYLLLCYLTVRRYKQKNAPQYEEITIYNRERTINCSLINENNGNIDVIYAIEIIPVPEESTIELQYYRPSHQKSIIHFPFIDPQFISSKMDQMLIDDPYVIIQSSISSSLPMIKRFTSAANGLYLQVSNDIPNQSYKEYNILILNDTKKKQQMLGQSRRHQRSKIRIKGQSKITPDFVEESSGPKLIRFSLRVWGCMKLQIQVPLWCENESFFRMSNDIFKSRGITNFYLVSDDEQVLKFWQDRKHRQQGLQLLKVSNDSMQTEVGFSVYPCSPNDSYISIHAIDASDAVEQLESLKLKQFKYIEPFYRMVLHLHASIPNFKELLKININRGSQGILEQPFTYRSNCNKKTEFRVYSNDAALVWVKSSDAVFQIESKTQRKLHIHFHTDKIVERSILLGACEGIVLGIKWEKGIDYYGFKFNIN